MTGTVGSVCFLFAMAYPPISGLVMVDPVIPVSCDGRIAGVVWLVVLL